MSELDLLSNGRFLENLDDWTPSAGASFSVGDGDDHYGVAVLPAGDSIAQDFSVDRARSYTLHLSLKSTETLTAGKVTAVITDENGDTVATLQPLSTVVSTWAENEHTVGLVPGVTYTLTITNAGAAASVKVDDVWFWYVPITRAAIAARVHTKLGRLATNRSLNTTPAGALTEGSYTYSVDAGLRAVGAVNDETGNPDVRYLGPDDVDTVIDAVESEMLDQLYRDYSTEVDVRIGPRSENLSQIAKAIGEMRNGASAAGSSGGRVVVRRLRHSSLGDNDD